jgi:hypothetical protein
VEDAIRIALFLAFTALFARVALGQARRLRRIHRRYSDPATVARLLVDERGDDGRPRADRTRPADGDGRD